MPVRFAVVVFPGSNCDHDAFHAVKKVMSQEARFVWHKDEELGDVDVVIVPGGFSYGDYLRAGAMAQFSPIMKEVVRFAADGGLVMGICNGFQVLCEAGLLPGALGRNTSLRFASREVMLKVENAETPFTRSARPGQLLSIPAAHGSGRFVADEETLDRLEANGQVVLRYVDEAGEPTPESNLNGSERNIAGIVNERGNVLGMMPHPERCVEALLVHGTEDGKVLFDSVIEEIRAGAEA